jgi:uncharacterized protein (UPF0332 family)
MSEDVFLEKAQESLMVAKLAFDNNCYNSCANRAYYGALQAAIAALKKKHNSR